MRVVGGKSGGVPLTVPKRGTRPTSDKVMGALFSMINEFIEGSNCLDLFAGSGALGLEALSRGAESCVFVDMGKESCLAISSNLKKTRLEKGFVKRQVAKSYIQNCNNSFDVIFADPPYEFTDNKSNFEELFFSNSFYDILNINSKREIVNYTIYDLNGRRMNDLQNSSNKIDVSKLNPGIYFLKLLVKSKQAHTFKFIKL